MPHAKFTSTSTCLQAASRPHEASSLWLACSSTFYPQSQIESKSQSTVQSMSPESRFYTYPSSRTSREACSCAACFLNSRRGAATIWERQLLIFVQHFRRCGDCSRVATNRERHLIEWIRYIFVVSQAIASAHPWVSIPIPGKRQ